MAGVAGLLWMTLVEAPARFVPADQLDERKVQNEVRTTLMQGLGGVVLGVGAYFTARQLKTSQQAQEIAREGQITERYTRAVDQLGHAELDVRIGGIYALQRIARDSPDDQPTVSDVLTSFVRGRSPWPPRLPGQFVEDAPFEEVTELQVRNADVQAAVNVLGRSGFADAVSLDLQLVDLRRADLLVADLTGADLTGAHLEGAKLYGADLEGAFLIDADLQGAILREANLDGANLFNANLALVDLEGADLKRSNLAWVDLTGANLTGARLEGANLTGAHLEGANLTDAHLDGVAYDDSTTWPEGFELDTFAATSKDGSGDR